MEIPQCFNVDFNNPEQWSKAPEDKARELFKNLGEDELAMRLIYAELLASDCSSLKSDKLEDSDHQMITWIASVILNRVDFSGYPKKITDVVFQKVQFRSSFGGCSKSTRQHLVCPTHDNKLYRKYWDEVKRIYSELKSPQKEGPKRVASAEFYYFPLSYKGDTKCEKFATKEVKTEWEKGKKKLDGNACIEIYKKSP